MALTCGVRTWPRKSAGSLLSSQGDRNGLEQRSPVNVTILLSARLRVGSTTPLADSLIYCPNIYVQKHSITGLFLIT